uniref:SPIN90/Ldb17 leucine-rich domain-containing protein n=1 Tax=Eutreptiella gymnastica TaxID=73025 RepID=A0A7S4G772_9EUGL
MDFKAPPSFESNLEEAFGIIEQARSQGDDRQFMRRWVYSSFFENDANGLERLRDGLRSQQDNSEEAYARLLIMVTVFTTELLNLGLELCEYAGVPPGVHLVLQEVVGWLSQQYHRNRESPVMGTSQCLAALQDLLGTVVQHTTHPKWDKMQPEAVAFHRRVPPFSQDVVCEALLALLSLVDSDDEALLEDVVASCVLLFALDHDALVLNMVLQHSHANTFAVVLLSVFNRGAKLPAASGLGFLKALFSLPELQGFFFPRDTVVLSEILMRNIQDYDDDFGPALLADYKEVLQLVVNSALYAESLQGKPDIQPYLDRIWNQE